MANGGFDVVIGNPPYVTYQMSREEKEFYKVLYASSISGKINTYRVFIQRALLVMKESGLFAFIIPNTWMSDKSASSFRKMLLENFRIMAVHVFGEKFSGRSHKLLQS
jgi:tRNA1(Val) A37 N6-methylase TrmN6